MQTEPNIIPYYHLRNLLDDKKVRILKTKNLNDGIVATWFTSMPGCKIKEIIEINETLYTFDKFEDALDWYFAISKTPEHPKRTIVIDYNIASKPLSLDYNPLTYEFFSKCRIRHLNAVLSETILKDGRVSVLYADIPNRVTDPNTYLRIDYYLLIGHLVFAHWNPEPLILLEALINSEYLTALRPELTGKMNYLPQYKLSVFNKHHSRFLKEMHIIKSFITPTGLLADVYAKKENPGNCRIMAGDLIYSFKTVADCDIVIDALIANDIRVQPLYNKESVKKNLEVIGARLNRFINADMTQHKSSVMVLESGSFTGLNATS